MGNEFRDMNAEDILSGDGLIRELKEENTSGQQPDENEFLALDIANTVANEKRKLDPKQKEELGRRIIQTIYNYKRRRLVIGLSYAAGVALLVGITLFFQFNNEPDIRVFAQNSSVQPSENTRLILSGEKEILIDSKNSKIEYERNGNKIRIDALHDVKQNVKVNDLVMNTLVVPYGKRTQITLSDHSKIWLNSGSKLIYPACFAPDKREVYLEGEAIFEVSHNKLHPFFVVTSDLEVKVLGTVFNVSSYKDDRTTSTVLESGSVELNYKGNSLFGRSKETMVPGMLAVYDPENGKLIQSKVDTQNYMSWRDGYFVFDKQPLGGILKKISRYYNVSIQLNDRELANETFSGHLDLKNSPDQVLQVIAEIINVKVENIDNQILITRI